MATLKLKNINKVYPNGYQAVYDFNLDIKDKEFIVFVGPSGCGKSTTLRMVAGLEEITDGELYIDDRLVNEVPPKDRDIAMVFQSYALYPHMTVYENMAFGLKLRKLPKQEIDEKVKNAAEILGLTPYLRRKPKALSGGQRQRVALGRAIVRDAKVFLMDEPLSNLDAKLRVVMRGELIKLHKSLETTTIYVTHDQIEAMTMADRIVVMNSGYIMQVGSPKQIYDYPDNIFVAGFIGTPPMNFIRGKVNKKGVFTVENTNIKLQIPAGKLNVVNINDMFDKPIILGIRPEDIYDDANVMKTYPGAIVDVDVSVVELLGAQTHIHSQLGENEFAASIDARFDVSIGSRIKLVFDMNKAHFFDPESELRLKDDGYVKEVREKIFESKRKREQELLVRQRELAYLKETDPKAYEELLKKQKREEKKFKKEELKKLPKEDQLTLWDKIKKSLDKKKESRKNKKTKEDKKENK